MHQIAKGETAPFQPIPQTLAHHNIPQYRAFSFVSDRIAEADASQWHAGYIHGLIQALTLAGAITVDQACKLEQVQERAACSALSRRAAGGTA